MKDIAKLRLSSDAMDKALARLTEAVAQRRSVKHCLGFWSTFVRVRDGFRCVDCHAKNQIAAHHICRKSFLLQAALQTGTALRFATIATAQRMQDLTGAPTLDCPWTPKVARKSI